MGQQIDAEIIVNSDSGSITLSPFNHFRIEQSLYNHHAFEVRFPAEVIEKRGSVMFEEAKGCLGKKITFKLSQISEDGKKHASTFIGVVTDVSISQFGADGSDLILKGYSPDIILDGAKCTQSFSEKNLKQIVDQVTKDAPGNLLSVKNSPISSKTLLYTVEYKETHHEFIKRMAAEHGEWYYYTGQDLIFGSPDKNETLSINYRMDISEYNFSFRVVPNNFTYAAYDYVSHQLFQSSSSAASVSGLETFGNKALKDSNSLFSINPAALVDFYSKDKGGLDALVKLKKAANAASLVMLNGTCDDPGVRLGRTIQVSATKVNNSEFTKEDLGKFTIVSVVHTSDGLGNYHNYFQAIPSNVQIPPPPSYIKPVSESQPAVVKKNDDPESIGRVRVHFPWQPASEMTPWMRLVTPHSGVDKGMYFIPEVGEDVLVGFEQNNPEMPFVLGSLYHGKAKSGMYDAKNYKKGIKTKSGNSILINDEPGKESVKIVNKDGSNFMLFSMEDGGKITVHAKTKMLLSSKNINIEGEEIKIKATKNIQLTANDNVAVKAKNNKIDATQNFEVKSMETKLEASTKLEAKAMEMKLESSTKSTIKAGVQVEVSAGAQATVKAAIIMLN